MAVIQCRAFRMLITARCAGHFVPSKANWRNFLKAYLKDPLGDVPSPSAAASQPTSGVATPVTPAP